MVKLYHVITALIGALFIIVAWYFKFPQQSGEFWSCVLVGAAMCLTSLLSFKSTGWNLFTLIAGIWFLVFPNVYMLGPAETWAGSVGGGLTVLLALLV